jgi:hypothetical protein
LLPYLKGLGISTNDSVGYICTHCGFEMIFTTPLLSMIYWSMAKNKKAKGKRQKLLGGFGENGGLPS